MFRFGIMIAFVSLLCAFQLSGEKLNEPLSLARVNVTDVHLKNGPDDPMRENKKTFLPRIIEHHSEMNNSSVNLTNFLRLEDVLKVFDIVELARKWHSIKNEFKSLCRTDMTDYFYGLKQHSIWATKSECSSSINDFYSIKTASYYF